MARKLSRGTHRAREGDVGHRTTRVRRPHRPSRASVAPRTLRFVPLAGACDMTEKKRRPAKKRVAIKSPYFLQPGKQGAVIVLRRPAGNRIDPKLCGTMDTRALALAFVKQLEKAESVVHDLFLEATDDGIEALEAVLDACRQSVIRRADSATSRGPAPTGGPKRRGRARRRGTGAPRIAPDSPPASDPGPS